MLDKILTDEKTFRIICLILFAIIFFVILRKNKKEKFSQLSDANLQAIKNLGDLASQITSPSDPGKLKLNELIINDGTTDFNILQTIKDIQATNVSQGRAISAAQAKADAALPKSGGTINGNVALYGKLAVIGGWEPLRVLSSQDSYIGFANSSGEGQNKIKAGSFVSWTGTNIDTNGLS